jgi:uncharacterized protein (TIGR01777 family)
MHIFMTGGTGFVGRTLCRILLSGGHRISVLTRSVSKLDGSSVGFDRVVGNPFEEGEWQDLMHDCDAVINLAGASIFTRWTEKAKRRILESRVRTTRNVVFGMTARPGPKLLISASAVGFYGFHARAELTESSPPGSGFLAEVTRKWENEALSARRKGVRVVLCRSGIVLGPQGGALRFMVPLFRWGLGSPLGNGDQWFSWIHIEDLARAVAHVLQSPDIGGPVNMTSPHPVTNRELTRALHRILRRRRIMPPVPGFLLRAFLGEFGDVVLKGQRVIPGTLLRSGYDFRFPDLDSALKDIIPEYRKSRPGLAGQNEKNG